MTGQKGERKVVLRNRFYLTLVREFPKKRKKFKKNFKKKIILASFQAETCQDKPKTRTIFTRPGRENFEKSSKKI